MHLLTTLFFWTVECYSDDVMERKLEISEGTLMEENQYFLVLFEENRLLHNSNKGVNKDSEVFCRDSFLSVENDQ